MLEIADDFYWTEHRKVLTAKESLLKAVPTFGYSSSQKAEEPIKEHIHSNCIEIVYIVKGFQFYQVEQEPYPLYGSNVFATYPKEVHSSGVFPSGVCQFFWLQINIIDDIEFLGLDKNSADFLKKQLAKLPRVFTADKELGNLLMLSFKSLSNDDYFQKKYGQSLLVFALYQMISISKSQKIHLSSHLEKAVSYIHSHIHQDIALEDVASVSGFSLSRFKVRFKDEIGITPRDYINHIKIQRAKPLLACGKTVTEVAFSLGFSNSNYFSVIFKKYTGQSPSQYQKQYKPKNI